MSNALQSFAIQPKTCWHSFVRFDEYKSVLLCDEKYCIVEHGSEANCYACGSIHGIAW